MNNRLETELRSPYHLTEEQLTAPSGPHKLRDLWLESIIGRQLEGIANGVRPQNIVGRGEPRLGRKWMNMVWKTYVETLPEEDKLAVKGINEGEEKFSRALIEPAQEDEIPEGDWKENRVWVR